MRSLYNKIDVISHEIHNLSADIINLSETWLQNELVDHFVNIQNYSLVRNDRNTLDTNGTVKRGGGICTYIKKGLIFNVLDDLFICNKDIELSVIQYTLPFTRRIFLLSMSIDPLLGILITFFKVLQDNINIVRINNKIDIFIGSDFNIDVKDKKHLLPQN